MREPNMRFGNSVKPIVAALLCLPLIAGTALADHIWINEIHYDNAGADVNEQVEVVIRTPNGSGETASSYALEFYNGSNGSLYNTTGTLDTFSVINPLTVGANTFTFYTELVSGIQNGSPDGIALVDVVNNSVVQFLSYEGAFTADPNSGGIAAGETSTDIGVAETTSTVAGLSLGLTGGPGQAAADFFWVEDLLQTPGAPNVGQLFVPEPASIALLFAGLMAVPVTRRRC